MENFKQELLNNLDKNRQNAIVDILEKIDKNFTTEQYNRDIWVNINNQIGVLGLSIFAVDLVQTTKHLINSINNKEEENIQIAEPNTLKILPNITELTGLQVELFMDAIISAFPTMDELKRFVRLKLNKNLDTITSKNNLTDTAFDLISYFESNGKLNDLISNSYQAKPQNPKIIIFINTLIP